MTREDLEREINSVIRDDLPASLKVDDIMKLVDNYTVEPGMIPDSRFSIHSDNNCKYPVCPCCGSLKYTIVSHPNGNHRCDRCGRVYFFKYNQSI